MTVGSPAVSRASTRGPVVSASIGAALIVIFVAMRLWRVEEFSLDGDEIFIVLLGRDTWANLFSRSVQDAIHPPLFYLPLKPGMRIGGESLLWLRLLAGP